MSRTQGSTTRGSALVTGASAGIGRELARLLAADGYDLVLVARDEARLKELERDLCQRFPISTHVLATDLSRESASDEIRDELQRRSIDVEVLINNAGFNVYGEFETNEWDDERALLQVCALTPTRLMKLFLPSMIERGSGRVLNVGSTGSFVPGPRNAVYCATKAYLLSLSSAIRRELRGTGVTLTTLCPGATDSEFAQRAHMGETRLFRGWTMRPEKVAKIGYSALMRGRSVVVPGLVNKLMMASVPFTPQRLTLAITDAMMR